MSLTSVQWTILVVEIFSMNEQTYTENLNDKVYSKIKTKMNTCFIVALALPIVIDLSNAVFSS